METFSVSSPQCVSLKKMQTMPWKSLELLSKIANKSPFFPSQNLRLPFQLLYIIPNIWKASFEKTSQKYPSVQNRQKCPSQKNT